MFEVYLTIYLVCVFLAYGFVFGMMSTPEFRADVEAKEGTMSDSFDYWTSLTASLVLSLGGPITLALIPHKHFKII